MAIPGEAGGRINTGQRNSHRQIRDFTRAFALEGEQNCLWLWLADGILVDEVSAYGISVGMLVKPKWTIRVTF